MYIYSGECTINLQSHLKPGDRGRALFENTVAGSVGVFTYRLQENSEKTIAVMWSVPYDSNIYPTLCAIGLFDNRDGDESLYQEMYYSKEKETFERYHADNRKQTYRVADITISCQMTKSAESKMTINISSSGPANQGGGRSLKKKIPEEPLSPLLLH